MALIHGDASALACRDGCYDQVLLFFLLHEQPEDVRRATVSEALRVVKPGGQLVIVDYHRPSKANPLHWPMRGILRTLEPYALDLWQHELEEWLPRERQVARIEKQTMFGTHAAAARSMPLRSAPRIASWFSGRLRPFSIFNGPPSIPIGQTSPCFFTTAHSSGASRSMPW